MSKLHIFDMDGTLLRGSACLELARYVGHLEAVNEMEEAWGRGEIGHVAFYELLCDLWHGLDDAGVDETFAATPWLDGVEAAWRDIAQRGEHSAVITMSPQFFADRLLKWGVGSVHGALVEAGVAPNPDLVLFPEHKVDIARDLMERYQLSPADCVAYGDSSSDVPLFEALPHTVAVNGSPSLRDVAAAVYDGTDLREAYAIGRSLLDVAAQASQSSTDDVRTPR